MDVVILDFLFSSAIIGEYGLCMTADIQSSGDSGGYEKFVIPYLQKQWDAEI
jgi:hypothetical protein